MISEHRRIMDPSKFTFEDQVTAIQDYLNEYLKRKRPVWGLYSGDCTEFKMQKGLFGQSNFLREILSQVPRKKYCGIIEILCACCREKRRPLAKNVCTVEIDLRKKSIIRRSWRILTKYLDSLKV